MRQPSVRADPAQPLLPRRSFQHLHCPKQIEGIPDQGQLENSQLWQCQGLDDFPITQNPQNNRQAQGMH